MKFTTLNRFAIILGVVIMIISCPKSPTDPEDIIEEHSVEIVVTVFPNIGTNATRFQPDVFVVADSDTVQIGEDYLIRCDYDGDGVADTDWLDSIPMTTNFTTFGKHTLGFEIQDTSGVIDSAYCDVYVQRLVQITPTNTFGYVEGNIDWSRDGTNRVAYDRMGEDKGSFRAIWVIEYPGGVPEQVTFNPDTTEYYGHQFPEWSPSGDRISFTDDALGIVDLSTNDIEIIDENGWGRVQSWSPNSRWLISWSVVDNKTVTVVHDMHDGSFELLLDDLYMIAWSPDGSKIATAKFGDWENSTFQIIDFPSRSVVEEYIIPSHGSKIEWSPNGKWISLGFHGMKRFGYLFNYENKTTYTYKPDGLRSCWFPSWSEDGSLLAFEGRDETDDVWLSIWAIEFPDEL
ncbi:MAG: hypothetical protein HON27_10115 [Candidatus Marinimicrobia bacterium]|jgi:hypothetical protein|nr:hypothetical protein [Candidatus Neomarinimicrobiota bacterium]